MNRTMMQAAMLLVGAGVAAGAAADERIGPATREWLELQRSGKAAGPAQRLSAPAEARAYARYLEAFTHPIPEFYEERESFLAESDTGG
jgi:hypothetical protein